MALPGGPTRRAASACIGPSSSLPPGWIADAPTATFALGISHCSWPCGVVSPRRDGAAAQARARARRARGLPHSETPRHSFPLFFPCDAVQQIKPRVGTERRRAWSRHWRRRSRGHRLALMPVACGFPDHPSATDEGGFDPRSSQGRFRAGELAASRSVPRAGLVGDTFSQPCSLRVLYESSAPLTLPVWKLL